MNATIHSPEYRKLTNWLKSQREAKGLSMRELAEKMNITHSFIGKIEQRERRLDIVEYMHYCDALEVSPVDGLRIIDKNL